MFIFQSRNALFTPTGIYGHFQPKSTPTPPLGAGYPIHPDVKLKKLPFYDHLGELLKPSSLCKYFQFLWELLFHVQLI